MKTSSQKYISPNKRGVTPIKKQSNETRKLKSIAMIGKNQPVTTCPHCGITGGASNLKRYHFTNCKINA